jgi:hypothetical protein
MLNVEPAFARLRRGTRRTSNHLQSDRFLRVSLLDVEC